MRPVNLLPLDARAQKQRFTLVSTLSPARALQVGGVVVAAVVVLLGITYVHERSTVQSKQQQLADTNARLAAVQAKVAKVQTVQRQAQARYKVVQSIASSRMNWDGTLMDLARVTPSGVYLTSLTAATPTTASLAASVPASTFTISGSAPSYKSTGSVLDRLGLLPWLTNVALVTSARQDDGTVTFSVQGTVQSGGRK